MPEVSFLDDVQRLATERITQALHRAGVANSAQVAAQISQAMTSDMLMNWGGQQVYVSIRGERLNQRIVSEFTGSNIPELVRKYRVSTKQVYRIIAQEKKRRTELQQTRLPGTSQPKKRHRR